MVRPGWKEAQLKAEYGEGSGKTLERPEDWGGFRVVPRTFEFWQGQSTRIHDRLRFRRKGAVPEGEEEVVGVGVEGEDGWIIERLSP